MTTETPTTPPSVQLLLADVLQALRDVRHQLQRIECRLTAIPLPGTPLEAPRKPNGER
jgi:hypothetical protein